MKPKHGRQCGERILVIERMHAKKQRCGGFWVYMQRRYLGRINNPVSLYHLWCLFYHFCLNAGRSKSCQVWPTACSSVFEPMRNELASIVVSINLCPLCGMLCDSRLPISCLCPCTLRYGVTEDRGERCGHHRITCSVFFKPSFHRTLKHRRHQWRRLSLCPTIPNAIP
jgi:hypothetical protein